jgi:DNA-binding FrmR family transcriptional regulator
MPEEAKQGGWLKNVASIFVEFEPSADAPQKQASSPQQTSQPASKPAQQVVPQVAPADFVEELRNRFKKILEEKNQPGFDFYEFSVMLLRSSPSPSSDQYKTAYEGAKMLNPSCTKEFLLTSANFYKQELQAAYQATAQTGEQKKGSIEVEKQNEQKQLSTDLNNIEQQLTAIKKQMQELEAKRNEKSMALQSIDQKYTNKLSEIEGKIQATATAKEAVLTDILLIEDGIKSFI